VRYLILSDIHANWEALQAVLDHAAGLYDQVICCGDLIGYGADPNQVCDWCRQNVQTVVRGNHDKASVGLEDLEWFNPVAKAAALWTQQTLTPENIEYVRNLPKGPLTVDRFQVLHGSPVDEDEYMIGASDAAQLFSYLGTSVAFFGHTHLQGGFIWNHSRIEMIGKPGIRENKEVLEIDPECAYMINPGSVGQPRDADSRAAYVIYDPDATYLTYYRHRYDVEKAQQKIVDAGLPPLLADRLAVGR
jgi:predicted phosphodiesterase